MAFGALREVMWKETGVVRLLGITRIPVLAFIAPLVLRLDDEGCEIKIPLGYRTRNHVGSMYLGVLVAGADLASGLNAYKYIREGHRGVVPVFKEVRAEFLKRADGDVHFRSHQGAEIKRAVEQADATGERVTLPVDIVATVPSKYADEPVAKFTLALSVKRK